MGKNIRLDANEQLFFKRQLEHIKSKTYDAKFKELKAFTLFPISTEAGDAVTEITYRKYAGIGFAKFISDYATDFPRVDAYGEEDSVKVYGIGSSYDYSIQEIRAAMKTGVPLKAKKGKFTRRAVEQVINNAAFNGDEAHGINGFINYPGITEYTVLDGDGGDSKWSTKTPDEIVADINGLKNAILEPTNNLEEPTDLLLPIKQYNYIASTRMTDGDSMTILAYIKQNIIPNVTSVVELKGAGDSGVDRMMMFKKNEDNLSLELPVPYEEFNPMQKGLTFEIMAHARTGGVIVYYPLSVAYGDDI